jgi:adenosylcobinamide-phosphate synthase
MKPWRMVEPVVLAALVIDAAIGWPAQLYRRIGHPVGIFARIIERCEQQWNRPAFEDRTRRIAGIGTIVILVAVAGGTATVLQLGLQHVLGGWAWLVIAALAAPGLAQRSLFDHVRAVVNAPDLADSRVTVGMIVGRDTQTLDEAGVARAAIESLAESFCDGVVAPLFWLLLLGLPGLWAYKAINTADSLIGHREERWRAFGWAAARTDDVLNLLPARLSGLLICVAGGGGWSVMMRDARKHASPNAGWPEAAMAGALGVGLAGPVAYDGVIHGKRWIGDSKAPASTNDIRRALRIYLRACLCLWVVAGLVAWIS